MEAPTTHAWHATVGSSGPAVTAHDVGYNGAPGPRPRSAVRRTLGQSGVRAARSSRS